MTQFDPKSALHEKLSFFEKNQFGISPMWCIVEEMAQKCILEPLLSEM